MPSNAVAPVRRVILGLGNPGERYVGTRHNRGREVVEELARRWRWRLDEEMCASTTAGDSRVLLACPETYMNRSGLAARCLLETGSIDPERMLVVYDDVALPLGSLRLRAAGGPGGQKGMASVIESLQTDRVPRLRLGVGPAAGEEAPTDLVEYVLAPFSADQSRAAQEQIAQAADACECWLAEGLETAMNRFNARAVTEEEPSVAP